MLEAPGRNATGWTLFFWLRIERAVQVCGAAYFGRAFKYWALVGHKYYSLRFNDDFQNYWISPSNPQISSLKKKENQREYKNYFKLWGKKELYNNQLILFWYCMLFHPAFFHSIFICSLPTLLSNKEEHLHWVFITLSFSSLYHYIDC